MKKLVIIFTMLSAVLSGKSFSQDKTPAVVSKSFKTSFTGIKEVSWSEVNHLYKAAFTSDGQEVFAYFNAEGNMVASARNVSLLQLPLSLQISLRKNYQNYTPSAFFEVDNEVGATYYATIENSNNKMQLQSTSYADWDAYTKSRM